MRRHTLMIEAIFQGVFRFRAAEVNRIFTKTKLAEQPETKTKNI